MGTETKSITLSIGTFILGILVGLGIGYWLWHGTDTRISSYNSGKIYFTVPAGDTAIVTSQLFNGEKLHYYKAVRIQKNGYGTVSTSDPTIMPFHSSASGMLITPRWILPAGSYTIFPIYDINYDYATEPSPPTSTTYLFPPVTGSVDGTYETGWTGIGDVYDFITGHGDETKLTIVMQSD